MRSVVSYALIAIIGGVVGAAVTQSGDIYDKVTRHLQPSHRKRLDSGVPRRLKATAKFITSLTLRLNRWRA